MEAEQTETQEQAKERKFKEKAAKIQQEYNLKCAELGQATYKIEALGWEIEATERQMTATKQRLKELNEKAASMAKSGATDEQD